MTNLIKPVLFSTANSFYMYDDSTQIILPISHLEYEFINNSSADDFTEEKLLESSTRLYQMMKKYHLFHYSKKTVDLNAESCKNSLYLHGIRALILSVDESCNMRCRYCYFSDQYTFSPKYSNKKMSFEVARKAVDYYVHFNQKAVKSNPNLNYSIGFYGGEPLLNWDVIRDTVEYCKKQYPELADTVQFAITTNALLLDEDKIQFMLDNNFSISVSFDGNQEEHDRNRVDFSGRGTFYRVYNTLKTLESRLNEKKSLYGNNKASYNVLITYDNRTNLIALNTFFAENPWLDKHILRINRVSAVNTNYYDSQKGEIAKQFIEAENQLIEIYAKDNLSLRTHFLEVYIRQMLLLVSTRSNYTVKPLRGCCIPGEEKIHVDTDGMFHVCEKINRLYPIGDIENGISFANQAELVKLFQDAVDSTCATCNMQNICTMCYATLQNDGRKLMIDRSLCEAVKRSVPLRLSTYYSLLEKNIQV